MLMTECATTTIDVSIRRRRRGGSSGALLNLPSFNASCSNRRQATTGAALETFRSSQSHRVARRTLARARPWCLRSLSNRERTRQGDVSPLGSSAIPRVRALVLSLVAAVLRFLLWVSFSGFVCTSCARSVTSTFRRRRKDSLSGRSPLLMATCPISPGGPPQRPEGSVGRPRCTALLVSPLVVSNDRGTSPIQRRSAGQLTRPDPSFWWRKFPNPRLASRITIGSRIRTHFRTDEIDLYAMRLVRE